MMSNKGTLYYKVFNIYWSDDFSKNVEKVEKVFPIVVNFDNLKTEGDLGDIIWNFISKLYGKEPSNITWLLVETDDGTGKER